MNIEKANTDLISPAKIRQHHSSNMFLRGDAKYNLINVSSRMYIVALEKATDPAVQHEQRP